MENKDNMVLVGYTQKPFGLIGEMKVKPESFDLNRHELLKEVFFKKTHNSKEIKLDIQSSRIQNNSWLLRFKGYTSPESLKGFSGGMLFVSHGDRLPLPENMIYIYDVIGYKAVDEKGSILGKIKDVQEHGSQEILLISPETDPLAGEKAPFLVPWNDIFVKNIDTENKAMILDVSKLEGLL